MEIGLYQMSLPPCGLCFSDILGEEKKKVHVVSNIPGKIPLFEDLAVLGIGHCDFHWPGMAEPLVSLLESSFSLEL